MDELLLEFHQAEYLKTDPLQFAHQYSAPGDQEIIALIAALFAFGNVKSIHSTVSKIIGPLGASPYIRLLQMSDQDLQETYANVYYRFYSSGDILHFMIRLRDLIAKHKSLENYFSRYARGDLELGLLALRTWFLNGITLTPGLRFMFADPRASSAKRWHLWLRWMVRKDKIDLGLWKCLKPSQLILPLDVHVFQLARHLGLTEAKTPSRRVAYDVTQKFKLWDAEDPIKYDFALCRLGILGLKKTLLEKASRFKLRKRNPKARPLT